MSNNPRGRFLGDLGKNASPSATLPGLIKPTVTDPALQNWIDAIQARAEIRDGGRNDWEKGVTKRDLHDTLIQNGLMPAPGAAIPLDGIAVNLAGGATAYLSNAAFAASIKGLKLYKDLMARLDDASRFDNLPERVRAILSTDLADLAAQIGEAAIRNSQDIVQSATESFAQTTSTITAALNGDVAGLREVSFASVNLGHAVAGRVITVEARINGVDGGSATIEEAYTATADAITGLDAQWTMKVNAGGHFAGIGLAATSPTAGGGTSAIIMVAEKFALIGPSETIADPTSPPVDRVPFGYDSGTNTLFLNGSIKINAGGSTLIQGLRGTLVSSVDGVAWSDTVARNAIWTLLGNGGTPSDTKHLVIGDQVTIWHTTTFAMTKMWLGSSWSAPGVVLNGDMLVDGGISARVMQAGSITAANAALDTACVTVLKIGANQVTVPSAVDFTGPYNGGGSPKTISTTVTLAAAGVIEAVASVVQGWSAGFVGWQLNMTINATSVFDTGTVGGGAFQQAAPASGSLSVGAGTHTVYLTWVGATAGIQLGSMNLAAMGAMR